MSVSTAAPVLTDTGVTTDTVDPVAAMISAVESLDSGTALTDEIEWDRAVEAVTTELRQRVFNQSIVAVLAVKGMTRQKVSTLLGESGHPRNVAVLARHRDAALIMAKKGTLSDRWVSRPFPANTAKREFPVIGPDNLPVKKNGAIQFIQADSIETLLAKFLVVHKETGKAQAMLNDIIARDTSISETLAEITASMTEKKAAKTLAEKVRALSGTVKTLANPDKTAVLGDVKDFAADLQSIRDDLAVIEARFLAGDSEE